MKRLTLFWALFFLVSPLPASTVVPDTLTGDVQWDSSNSPYIIQGKVDVPVGSTLSIGPGVHVVYQGVGELAVEGNLTIAGSAAAPVVFDMTQAGLQSQFFLNGAQADIQNAKFLGGIFLARDSQLNVASSEFTQGSGVYLQGKTTAYLKSNKIYGNATGAVLDGADLSATFVFNTFVQNTYGLDLKNYSYLKFKYNSVHDNQEQLINETHGTASVGDNYWGSIDDASVHLQMRGQVDLTPIKDLKDVLRTYIMTQLPEITVTQSEALAAKEIKEDKAEKLALKKFKKEEAKEAREAALKIEQGQEPTPVAAAPPPPSLAPAVTESQPEAAPEATQAPAPEAAETETEEAAPAGVAAVKALPPAPHSLTPIPNLPEEQDVNLEGAPPTLSTETAPEGAPAETAAPPAETPAVTPVVEAPPASAAVTTAPPPPPVLPSEAATATAAAPEVVPPPPMGSSDEIPPPPVDNSSVAPAASSVSPAPPPPDSGIVPPPPTANPANGMEELPAAATSAATSTTAPASIAAPPPPPAPSVPQAPVTSTGNTSDDLTAPPADTSTLAPGAPSAATTQPAPAANQAPASNADDLALPPIQDLDVAPPKDLDLPPADDLGNLDLNTKK
jgi:hypothetical protein